MQCIWGWAVKVQIKTSNKAELSGEKDLMTGIFVPIKKALSELYLKHTKTLKKPYRPRSKRNIRFIFNV
jgi:hypothetical protein